MRSNARMRELLRATGVSGLGHHDIPPLFRDVAERGWSVTAAGGRVLNGLRPETPGRYVDRVRLEHARRLLEETSRGVEEVARAAGYGTPETMRRAFLKALGTAPAEYRRRFHSPVRRND